MTCKIRIYSAIATKQQITLACNLSSVVQYVTGNLILSGLFLAVAEDIFWFLWFVSPCHLESWLFSARALSSVSQPSYTAEDTGSTGLRSYCSKGKSLQGISPHNSSFWWIRAPEMQISLDSSRVLFSQQVFRCCSAAVVQFQFFC